MKHYKQWSLSIFRMSSHPVKTQKPLLKLSSDDSESAAYPSFVHKKSNLAQMKQEFNLRHKMTRYSKNLEVPWPTGPPGYTYVRGVYITRVFQGVLETRFRSLELKIGSLESAKIIIGSLKSEKIGSLESEKSGTYMSIPGT